MKQYTRPGLTFRGESAQLMAQCKEYSLSATYIEPNIHDLVTKIMNMTMSNQVIVSYADAIKAGLVNATISQEDGDPPFQVQKHDGFEIIFVANGSFLETVGEKAYRMEEFDAILMNPNCMSMITGADNLIAIAITISRAYLEQHDLLKELKCLSHRSRFDKDFTDAEYALFRTKGNAIINEKPVESDGISPQRKEDVKTLFYQLHDEMRKKAVGYDYIVPGLLKRLLDSLCNANLYDVTTVHETQFADAKLAEQIKAYLEQTPMRLTVEELTEVFHYSRNYLSKIFLAHANRTIKDYNREICMKEAKRLLQETDLSVSAVAERVGYMSRSQFYACFKEYYGCLPTEI